jgi:hypothetical protein
MSCKKCASGSKSCGCTDTAYTTPVSTVCLPACPPRCSEYISAACVVLSDGINDLGIHPGETLESILQRITLVLTNPLCVAYAGGVGSGIGNTLPFAGNGIVQIGLDAPSNIFMTPIVPVTAPGGNLILDLQDQSANTVFAGPISGAPALPQFRVLTDDDIPNLTTGSSVLMGDNAGKFTNVTIGPNLSFAGGILDADINVVIAADNGLSKNPLNADEVWLGGTLLQDTTIDGDSNAYSFTLSAMEDFIVETNNSIYLKTEFATDRTELFYDQSNAVFQYTDSASAVQTAYSGVSGINSIMGIDSSYGNAYISIEKGVSDNQILLHTPKIEGSTAIVNQVLTLKAITGEAEWENVIATISASEGLITDPLVPDDVQLGGPIASPASFSQSRFIDTNGYKLKLFSNVTATQILEIENDINSSVCLTVTQIAGDFGGKAIDIVADGVGLVVDTQTTGFEVNQRGNASYISTISDAGAVREVLNIRSPYLSSLPVLNYGAQLSFSLNDLITAGTLQSSALITSTYSNVSTGTGVTRLSFATKDSGEANPVTKFDIEGNGQIGFSNYGAGSFTSGTSTYNLAVDSNGYVMEVPATVSNVKTISMLALDVSASNAYANVTGLSFPVVSGQTYTFRFVCTYEVSATTYGTAWAIDGPTNSYLSYYSQWSPTTGGTVFNTKLNLTTYDAPAASGTTTATTGNTAIIEGVITPTANGTVIARFTTDATVGGTVTCKVGSTVEYYGA